MILEDIINVFARGDLGDHSPHMPDQPDAAKTESQPRKHKILRAGCETKNSNCGDCSGPEPRLLTREGCGNSSLDVCLYIYPK